MTGCGKSAGSGPQGQTATLDFYVCPLISDALDAARQGVVVGQLSSQAQALFADRPAIQGTDLLYAPAGNGAVPVCSRPESNHLRITALWAMGDGSRSRPTF